MQNLNLNEILPFIIPLVIIQFGLQIYALVNLIRRKKVRFGNKFIWGAIILLGQLLGPILYLVLRGDEE